MGLEEQIQKAVTNAVLAAMGEALKDLKPKQSDDGDDWIKVGQAAKMLGCDNGHIDKLIDSGFLTLCFLPGTTRGDRRLIRREVEELKIKYTVCPRTRTVK